MTSRHEDGAIHLTAATIDAVLAASPGPTLLDFGAPWCGPCKAISPMIDELAREMAGRRRSRRSTWRPSPRSPRGSE